MILFNPSNKKEHLFNSRKAYGEEQFICPECSESRQKKDIKCFSYNHDKQVGHCIHCSCYMVPKKEFEPKKEYKRPPKWANKTQLSEGLVKWFEGRGISQKTLIEFKIGEGKESMPLKDKQGEFKVMNTLQFNYFRGEELINIKYRGPRKEFKGFKDGELIPYNLNSIKDSKRVIICEGEIEAMSWHEAGYKEAVSVPNGATNGKINLDWLDSCIEYFANKTEIILATDDDTAGRNLKEQLAFRLGKERCKYVTFKGNKDGNDLLQKEGIQGLIECHSEAREFPLEGVFGISDFDSEINDLHENGLPAGARTLMPSFNKLIKFHLGYFTTITGTPGSGKTSFLDQVILQLILNNDWKVAYYSPESKPTSLHIVNLCCKLIGKKWKSKDSNLQISQKELEAAKGYLTDKVYFIEPEKDFTLDSILNAAKGLIVRKGINMLVLDAWNTVEHKYSANETQYVSESLAKFGSFCKMYNIHAFLVAHPTKTPKQKNSQEYEVPNLYSISGSANFYNKTDVGICVHRNYSEECTYVYVQKVKFQPYWGETGACKFKYDKDNGRYNEWSGGAMISWDKTPWIYSKKTTSEPRDENKIDKGIIINTEEPPF